MNFLKEEETFFQAFQAQIYMSKINNTSNLLKAVANSLAH